MYPEQQQLGPGSFPCLDLQCAPPSQQEPKCRHDAESQESATTGLIEPRLSIVSPPALSPQFPSARSSLSHFGLLPGLRSEPGPSVVVQAESAPAPFALRLPT